MEKSRKNIVIMATIVITGFLLGSLVTAAPPTDNSIFTLLDELEARLETSINDLEGYLSGLIIDNQLKINENTALIDATNVRIDILEAEAAPDTKYIEVLRIGPLQEYEEIFVDLSGYKEVQVSYHYNIWDAFSSGVTMFWAIESLGEETGIPPLAFGGFGGKGSDHVSFPVSSNVLKIVIGIPHPDPNDYVKIIFYATK